MRKIPKSLRQLVEFACSLRFSGQLDQALKEHATGPVAGEADVTNVVDHFILQQPLADGHTGGGGQPLNAEVVSTGDNWVLTGLAAG